MANYRKISLLIHGPLSGHCIDLIKLRIDNSPVKFSDIVVVSYVADYPEYRELLDKEFSGLQYKIVQVLDLINPGLANINRQTTQVRAGLRALLDDSIVIKNRNDQTVDFVKLFDAFEEYKFFRNDEQKLMTTNCYTRVDRLYHPSDMFMVAPHEIMSEYFAYPLRETTEIMDKMTVAEMYKINPKMTFNPISPESEFFRNFLKNRKWKFLETETDSLNALKKYFYVLNSWDIGFMWNKPGKAGPNTGVNKIILPHTFVLSPFPGAPVEHHRCYNRHEIIGGFKTKQDIEYIAKSKIAWNSVTVWGKSSKRIRRNYVRHKIERAILRWLPYFVFHKRINKLNGKISAEAKEIEG